jgi:hypothetical protein
VLVSRAGALAATLRAAVEAYRAQDGFLAERLDTVASREPGAPR